MRTTIAAVLAVLAIMSCGGSSTPSTGGSYKGSIAGPGGESGVIQFTIPTQSAVTLASSTRATTVQISGTLTLGTTSIPLTGTFDPATGAFSVSGGGYTFTGTYGNGVIKGSYTGPNGMGTFASQQGNVTVLCGTYSGSYSGVWNLNVGADGRASGAWYGTDGSSGTLSGTISGNAINIMDDFGTASGTLSGSTASGTWTASSSAGGGAGTWSGSTACN